MAWRFPFGTGVTLPFSCAGGRLSKAAAILLQWTLYRIDYKGTRLCLDRFGSHYGSVANFPGVGFIGSGHTENENEQVLDLKVFVDGKPVPKPESPVRCRSIRLLKKSRIRTLVLTTEIEVRDGRILEDVRLRADKPTPVTLIYHFMHPWTPTATEYLAELSDGTRLEGVFNGDRKQKIDKPTRWSAVYDGPSGGKRRPRDWRWKLHAPAHDVRPRIRSMLSDVCRRIADPWWR